MTFQDKHKGQPLPPFGKEKREVVVDGEAGLFPFNVQGMTFMVSEQDIVGITSILQKRKGVVKNG